jgi:23S rRNA pseudouridine1911/1915/1917 synthase
VEGQTLIELPILYEDNHLLVVDKPAGMLAQADLGGDLDVLTLAKRVIKRRDGKPGNVFLGLVHRLDRPVSGVMALAKTSKAASRLSAQFRDREPEKRYLVVVGGTPDPQRAELRHYLRKDRAARITRVVGSERDGKPARLGYEVLETRGATSLLRVLLLTGLPHQIRAQLAAVGHPILGDRKYGSTTPFVRGKLALHAESLALRHPVRGERIEIKADPPAHWPW